MLAWIATGHSYRQISIPLKLYIDLASQIALAYPGVCIFGAFLHLLKGLLALVISASIGLELTLN